EILPTQTNCGNIEPVPPMESVLPAPKTSSSFPVRLRIALAALLLLVVALVGFVLRRGQTKHQIKHQPPQLAIETINTTPVVETGIIEEPKQQVSPTSDGSINLNHSESSKAQRVNSTTRPQNRVERSRSEGTAAVAEEPKSTQVSPKTSAAL